MPKITIDPRDILADTLNARIAEMLAPQFAFPEGIEPQVAHARLQEMQKQNFAATIVATHLARMKAEDSKNSGIKPDIADLARERSNKINTKLFGMDPRLDDQKRQLAAQDKLWWNMPPSVAHETAEAYAKVVVDNILMGTDTERADNRATLELRKGVMKGFEFREKDEKANPQSQPKYIGNSQVKMRIEAEIFTLMEREPARFSVLGGGNISRTLRQIAEDIQPITPALEKGLFSWGLKISDEDLKAVAENYADKLVQSANPMSLFARPGATSRALVTSLLQESDIDVHVHTISGGFSAEATQAETIRNAIMREVRQKSDKLRG